METALWFKMFLFLLVAGTFMSLMSSNALPSVIAMPATQSSPIPIIGDTINALAAGISFAATLILFFTGIGTLLGMGTCGGVACTPILPEPFNWILVVVIVAMWIFLVFEVVRTIVKSVLP